MKVPTTQDYVHAFLTKMRAETRKSTVFGQAGRFISTRPGERRILGPNGEPIRIWEDELGGVQVEHGDHLHACVRPPAVSALGRSKGIG